MKAFPSFFSSRSCAGCVRPLQGLLVLGFILLISLRLGGQVPFLEQENAERENRLQFLLDWQAAREASRNALSSLAVFSFEQLSRRLPPDPNLRAPFLRDYCRALISAGQFEAAAAVLDQLEATGQFPNESLLWRAWLLFQAEDTEAVEAAFVRIRRDLLPVQIVSWYDLLSGFRAKEENNLESAAVAFQRGLDSAPNRRISAYFEAILLRAELLLGDADAARAENLRQIVMTETEVRPDPVLVREYVMVLLHLDQREAALAFLRSQLERTQWDARGSRESLLLLKAQILPDDSEELRAVWTDLALQGRQRSAAQIALQSLFKVSILEENTDEFLGLLGQIINAPQHPLIDEALFLRAWHHLQDQRLQEAEADARKVLDQFPGSSAVNDALLILAQASWQSDPPRYRTAADYFLQLRDQSPDPEEQLLFTVWTADCFFLAGDFSRSATLYRDALQRLEREPLLPVSWVYFQLILSEIRRGQADAAIELLNDAMLREDFSPEDRWELEWLLSRLLVERGRNLEALTRLSGLISEESGPPTDNALVTRLLWLKAQLTLLGGFLEEAEQAVEVLEDTLKQFAENGVETLSRDLMELKAGSALIRAQLAISQNSAEFEPALFEKVREQFPHTEAAALSFFEEARLLAARNRSVEAQNLLVRLADTYATHRLAPVALYEAALLAEKRGLTAARREAINLLERLSMDFAGHPLFFSARLQQGAILRQLNEFSLALTLYDTLLQANPRHPQRPMAEMGRIESLIALGTRDPVRLEEAVESLQGLTELPRLSPDLKAEAVSKWIILLEQLGERERMRLLGWRFVDELLLRDGHLLGESGRYWVARLLLRLAEEEERLNNFQEAERFYSFFEEYKLPGQGLANARRSRLRTQTTL